MELIHKIFLNLEITSRIPVFYFYFMLEWLLLKVFSNPKIHFELINIFHNKKHMQNGSSENHFWIGKYLSKHPFHFIFIFQSDCFKIYFQIRKYLSKYSIENKKLSKKMFRDYIFGCENDFSGVLVLKLFSIFRIGYSEMFFQIGNTFQNI